MRVSRSGDNFVRETNKVVDRRRWPGHLPYGGDERVNPLTGISTENHHELYARLVKAGPSMHGAPGPRKPRKS